MNRIERKFPLRTPTASFILDTDIEASQSINVNPSNSRVNTPKAKVPPGTSFQFYKNVGLNVGLNAGLNKTKKAVLGLLIEYPDRTANIYDSILSERQVRI